MVVVTEVVELVMKEWLVDKDNRLKEHHSIDHNVEIEVVKQVELADTAAMVIVEVMDKMVRSLDGVWVVRSNQPI